MSDAPPPAEVMLAATMTTLRAGRLPPARVIKHQLDALTVAGYRLQPVLGDGGAARLIATAKRAFWSGRFRPADVIALELEELAAAGFAFEIRNGAEVTACDAFVWGPNSFDSCNECGLSFWRHGESGGRGQSTHHRR